MAVIFGALLMNVTKNNGEQLTNLKFLSLGGGGNEQDSETSFSILSSIRDENEIPSYLLNRMRQEIASKPRVNISLLVPCVADHVKWFKNFYMSLLAQTVLPAEFAVSFAMNEENAGEAFPDILSLLPLPEAKFYMRGGIHYPADQRTYLAEQSEQPILTYFDCDDYMHPQRLEFLTKAFGNNPDIDYLLHGCIRSNESISDIPISEIKNFADNPFTTAKMDSWKSPLSKEKIENIYKRTDKIININDLLRSKKIIEKEYLWNDGYMSLKKFVFDALGFPEGVGEDVLFTNKVIRSGFKLAGIDEPLAFYSKPSGGARKYIQLMKKRWKKTKKPVTQNN